MFGKARFFLLLPAPLLAFYPAHAASADTPPPAVRFARYKALYALRLAAAAPGSAVIGARGEMYYEQDDACSARTTEQRLVTRYDFSGGASVRGTARFATFESKDGRHFSFNARHQENGKTDRQISGSVTRMENGAGNAVYTRPDGTRYILPKGYFLPLAHIAAMIRHAKAGDHFFNGILFDGTDAAGAVDASVFIGKKETAAARKKIAGASKYIDAGLLAPEAWHIRMAVFPLKNKWQSTPAYEMDMILNAAGIVSHAVVHYKNFAVEQRLVALAPLAAAPCD